MKKKLTTITFLIFLVSGITSASAADITYTFDHTACATENPGICICDIYDSATDTCTINTGHSYEILWSRVFLHMNFNNLIIMPSGSITETNYRPTILTINSDSIQVSGAISMTGIDITSSSVHVTPTGIIDTGAQRNLHGDMRITITAPDINIEGTLDVKSPTVGASDITIQSTNLNVSGKISILPTQCPLGSITIQSANTDISGTIEIATYCYHYGSSTLIIESSDLNISGTVGYDRFYATKIVIAADNLHLSGSILNSGINKYNTGYRIFDLGGITSISAHALTIDGAGKIVTGSNQPAPIYITYCVLTPSDCEGATGCSQIVAGPGDLFLNNNCQVTATCRSGDGCIAKDPFSDQLCLPPDPDCPIGATGIPIPTFISLQGTVTDTGDNPINGTVTVTSLEKCQDTTCAAKTNITITGAENEISIKDSIVNAMLGPYNLILATTYILNIKVCDLTGLCDENIQIKFTD